MRWLVSLATLLVCVLAHAQEPIHRWDFTTDHVKNDIAKPIAGPHSARIIAKSRFSDEAPKALILPGAAKDRIEVTDDLKKAGLPTKAITAEAWVWIDRDQEWGGMIGAIQDNGAYEKGWLLGYHQSHFIFGIKSTGRDALTYLHAKSKFATGCWYHVVGTYDGTTQRIYIDGELQAESKDQKGEIDYPPKTWYTIAAYRDDDEHYPLAGRLERVSVWDQALSAEQVKAIFRKRKSRFPGIEPSAVAEVADWPTQMRDNRRSGATKEMLQFPLKLAWVHHSHTPQPAWPPEAKNDYYHKKYDLPERVTFDHAYHVVGVGDRVFFGSSADDSVHCLDANTGEEKWKFVTEGPVRLAPTVAGKLVLFGSDDGHVYAVNARDGKLAWKRRIAPEDRQIPGNGRIISAWPVRTDVLVEGEKAYACAGIFPSQGVYQVVLNVKDGSELSRQTLTITAQGYQERVFGKLMISTGRTPGGAAVAILEPGAKEPGKEAKTLSKDYPYALIRAGDIRIAGGDGKVAAFDASGKEIWSAKVEGKVHSLAVVSGRLVASTGVGDICCFDIVGGNRETGYREAMVGEPDDPPLAKFVREHANMNLGYCLVVGRDSENLITLAELSRFRVIFRDAHSDTVIKLRGGIPWLARKRTSIQLGSIDKLPYADMLFNVVVAVGASTPKDEVMRVLRPGGVAIFSFDEKGVVKRPPLPGAGEWTHMYGDAGNTSCSNDTIVGNQELRLQWWGRPGPRGLIDRHHRTVAPLYKAGRMFVPGEDRVTGVDAYNGTILWESEFPNSRRVIAFRDSSYLAVNDKHLFVAAADDCFAVDPDTGETKHTYSIPPKIAGKYEWGYTATVDGLLIGSGVRHGSIRREQKFENTVTITHWDFAPAVGSDLLFAYEEGRSEPKWKYCPGDGVIVNPTITIGGGRIYFVESTDKKTLAGTLAQFKLPVMIGNGCSLVCLDLQTGKQIWRKPGKSFANTQHAIFGSYSKDVLLIVGSRNSGTNPKKDTVWFDLHAFDAKTGEPIWSKSQDQKHPINGEHGEQDRHPAIVNGKVYCEPYAYDLKTGNPVEWKWPFKGPRRGCGTLSASASCFFFRDDTTQRFDLTAGTAKKITTETRPGCWINVIPAGGLVLAPEASSGCTCNYSVQTSLALIPVTKK